MDGQEPEPTVWDAALVASDNAEAVAALRADASRRPEPPRPAPVVTDRFRDVLEELIGTTGRVLSR
jgi:hypothetical protein